MDSNPNRDHRKAVATSVDLLVVIDHHEAKIFRSELKRTSPQRLVPFDPHGHGQHLRTHSEETNGQRKPELKSFYDAVALAIRVADKILIFGSGTGASSAMNHLVDNLKAHHPDVAKCVVGTVVIDSHHTTEAQWLAKAREFFDEIESPNAKNTAKRESSVLI